MQSYSSTVDGKTLIRVGGGHGSKPSAKTLQSNVVSNTAKIDHGLSMTSSRRPNSSSSINITSSTISIGESMVPSTRSTSGSVTVKTATSSLSSAVAPQKKMTSIIDTKSGVVTSSFAMVDPMTSSSAAAMTSPRVASRNDVVAMTLPNRSSASNASAKSTSVLMTSTTIPYTSRDAGETSVLMTSSIPRSSPADVRPSYATLMTSAAPKMTSSSVLTQSMPGMPSTSPVAMAMPSYDPSMKVVVAEVHEPSTVVDSEDLGHDLEDRLSSVSMPHPAESSGSKFKTPSESNVDEDAGSLVYTDEIDSQVSAENINRVELALPEATGEGSLPACNKNSSVLDSNPLSSPPLSSPSPVHPSLNSALDQPISVPRSFDGSISGETHPEQETDALTGSESAQQDEPETKKESTFNFIGWEVGNMADKMADRKCHRVLIFKDSEIVLMFKTSCLSEEAGNGQRLRSLMVDIAINCARRLKKMKDVSLPKLEAEHMDTLPLTDERQTRFHLDEISRELNENVTINDVAFRFQTTEDDTYIGTYVDRCNDAVQSTTEKTNCLIGRCGAVVVLKRKSRFATVESFSDQLCRHILSARPLSLGQISDLEVRRLSSTKTQLGPDKRQLLLFQDFISDPSIIVAEAARRSFLKIQDFLLFE